MICNKNDFLVKKDVLPKCVIYQFSEPSSVTVRSELTPERVNKRDAPIHVHRNACALVARGQKEEEVLCGMVACVTLQGRDVGESFLSLLQKVTDVPSGLLQVAEMIAQLHGCSQP